MRRNELVSSVRGPGGGYQLAREASAIQIVQVIDAVDESVDATRCKGKGNCQGGETCLTHYLWCELSEQIHDFLSDITLGSLVQRAKIRDIARRQQQRIPCSEELSGAEA